MLKEYEYIEAAAAASISLLTETESQISRQKLEDWASQAAATPANQHERVRDHVYGMYRISRLADCPVAEEASNERERKTNAPDLFPPNLTLPTMATVYIASQPARASTAVPYVPCCFDVFLLLLFLLLFPGLSHRCKLTVNCCPERKKERRNFMLHLSYS